MARRQPRIIKMNFDLENQDEQDLQDYINSQKEGRINPVEKAPVLDMKTNPRLTPPSPGEKVLPTEEKSEYWREELRRGKDPRDVLNQYLMDKLTQRERTLSPSVYESDVKDRKEASKDKMFMNLLRSGADLGASFGNRRYIDPNSPIPTSGFDPNIPIESMESSRKGIKDYRKEREGTSEIDQRVLMYLADKKQKEEAAKADAKLKMEIAKMRAENDPFKAMMFEMRKSGEKRDIEKFEMDKEKHAAAMEKQKIESSKEDELISRYKNQMRNLNKLESIVNEMSAYQASGITEGIANVFKDNPTAVSSEIDKTIYDLALDYAKTVDPTSVAREGEVAAAEKYALPIKRYIMVGQKDAALRLLMEHRYDIESRVRSASKQNLLPNKEEDSVTIEAPDGSRRQVPKSSMQKYLDKGGKLVK